MTKKLIYTVGLPGSGKTYWSKNFILSHRDIKHVSKDDLRSMLDNGIWTRHNEKFILKIRNLIIEESLRGGYDIIVGDTNFSQKHVNKFKELAKKYNAKLERHDEFLEVPVKECIKRDLTRENSVGKDVIMGMYNQFVKEKATPIEQNKSLPRAIVMDCDGTLALHTSGRSPYDWKRVGEDSLSIPVFRVYENYKNAGYKIIIFTGRDGSCEQLTKEWLAKNKIEYDDFYIRPTGNVEKDSIIKERMLKEVVKKYYIEVIYDDRDQVVKKHRELGFTCFQVNEGNF